MLVRLSVKNFALLKELDVKFYPGFSAITGETGSGKSLLVGAMSFLGGGRADPGILQDGNRMASVEAEFNFNDESPILLRREMHLKGRTRAFLNDSPVSAKVLTSTASRLFDITSQRAFSHLLEQSRHLNFLDQFANLLEEGSQLESFEKEYLKLKQKLGRLHREELVFEQKKELLQFQLDQFEAIDPQPDEEESLNAEVKRLEHFEDLHRDGHQVMRLLTEGNNAADINLGEAQKLLTGISKLDPSLSELLGELESSKSALREISRRVEERCVRITYESNKLEELRERQHSISGLIRKFGGSFKAMMEHGASLKRQLQDESTLSEQILKLTAERDKVVSAWIKLASRVSAARAKSSVQLEKAVVNSLAKLGVKNALFKIALTQTPDKDGLIVKNGIKYRLDRRGAETAEFLLSTNPGFEPRPLTKIASGGELSRLLLALKEALPLSSDEATIIFDEIDTGVSGHVAHLVGTKLRGLSEGRQMFAITHLPQIAGMSDHHFRVSKQPNNDVTETSVQNLSTEERIIELATMLSGGNITSAALDQARNLLNPNNEEVQL